VIKRYEEEDISKIWSSETKLKLWQRSQLTLVRARVFLGLVAATVLTRMAKILQVKIDLDWWLARDKAIHHDLKAFLDERGRHLPDELETEWGRETTSYDTEEPATVTMLHRSANVVEKRALELLEVLKTLAFEHQYTVMTGRTHGQEGDLQTFGKRCLNWYQDLSHALQILRQAKRWLCFARMSGAMGNNVRISPQLEAQALRFMRLQPYRGATQILPRLLFVPLASALASITELIAKIAVDLRLGARSSFPIYQEPFGKIQKGSSAMPHKRNPINWERLEGMGRMALGYLNMIVQNIMTWEERAIEQSSVERVAWPDLFHVTVNAVKTLTKSLRGLQVYPDNMLREVVYSAGTYAASVAKEVLIELGISREDSYAIIQLAAANAFTPGDYEKSLRTSRPGSLHEADTRLAMYRLNMNLKPPVSIEVIIREARLAVSPALAVDETKVEAWNNRLAMIMAEVENARKWADTFKPSTLLVHQAAIYKEVFKQKNQARA
jgi:adenylosuccinate lyase